MITSTVAAAIAAGESTVSRITEGANQTAAEDVRSVARMMLSFSSLTGGSVITGVASHSLVLTQARIVSLTERNLRRAGSPSSAGPRT